MNNQYTVKDKVTLVPAITIGEIETIRSLFVEYQQWLNFSLCFQGFDQELAKLPGDYFPPSGRLYIAFYQGATAGCIALRPMVEKGVCEMKRLFVREEFRGMGIGKFLAEKLLDDARKIGYHTMRLDTLQRMETARSIYQKFGFTVSPAYYDNPMDGVVYMELQL